MPALTCDRCLDGLHRRCRRRECACISCAGEAPPRRKKHTRPKAPTVKKAPRRAKKPTKPKGTPGPKPFTPEEEAEIRQMVLRLVEGVGRRAGRL